MHAFCHLWEYKLNSKTSKYTKHGKKVRFSETNSVQIYRETRALVSKPRSRSLQRKALIPVY